MSGYADYLDDKLYDENIYNRYNVPVIKATINNFSHNGIVNNFSQYGNFVYNYNDEKVIIVPWPVNGWRPLMGNTGTEGGITEGKFSFWLENSYFHSKNEAVGGDYITGRKIINEKENETYLLTREANYHPDGGQVFYPIDNKPFILLLALPGDDIKAEDFIAFKFDGSCGCQIKPNIWHQPVFQLSDNALFMTKQGKVHGCVGVDTIKEWNMWLKILL